MAFTTVPVNGVYRTGDTDMEGTVTFLISRPGGITNDGVTKTSTTFTVTDGVLSGVIERTDDIGTQYPTGVYYHVTEDFGPGMTRTYSVDVNQYTKSVELGHVSEESYRPSYGSGSGSSAGSGGFVVHIAEGDDSDVVGALGTVPESANLVAIKVA